jgi:outer membrane protein assembly factor BamD
MRPISSIESKGIRSVMKKILLLLPLVFGILLLTSCSKGSFSDFSAYKGYSDKQIFNSAEHHLAHHDYGRAVKDLEALDATYPFGPYAQQGQLDIIYAYYMNDDDASALASADRYIRLYPRDNHVDYAYYMKGLIDFNLGLTWLQKLAASDPAPRDLTNKKQAYLAFDQIVTLYPNSIYAPDSALRMAYIRNLVARKEVLIAKFYMRRKAYVAAANRAAFVVQHFDRSPEVVTALAILVKAYRKLHLQHSANQTLSVLAASYPHSKEYRQLVHG